jgi:hypothetical protein
LLKKKVLKTQRFQVKTLETAVKDPKWAEIKDQIQLVLERKEERGVSGESGEGAVSEEKDRGFESIPLNELMFYACVDADATRRIAIIQAGRMAEEDLRLFCVSREARRSARWGAKSLLQCNGFAPFQARCAAFCRMTICRVSGSWQRLSITA